jgi:hypothetical protein
MPGEGLLGGVIGGTIGAIGGAISAARQRKDVANTQRDVRRGVDLAQAETARSVGNIMTSKEYLTGANFIRSMFGIQGSAAEDVMRQVTGEFGQRQMLGSDLGPGGKGGKYAGFLHGTDFQNQILESGRTLMTENLKAVSDQVPTFGGLDPLSQDFVKNLRVSQAQRGLEPSMAAGAGEAAGLASFRTQMQSQMLPQLMALAENPASLRQRYESGNLQRDVYRAGAGGVAYGQANQSLFGSGPSVLEGMFQGGAAGFGAGVAQGNGMQVANAQEAYYNSLHPRSSAPFSLEDLQGAQGALYGGAFAAGG